MAKAVRVKKQYGLVMNWPKRSISRRALESHLYNKALKMAHHAGKHRIEGFTVVRMPRSKDPADPYSRSWVGAKWMM